MKKEVEAVSRKYFGTDGIRDKVGEALINPEFILKLGWAIGTVLRKKNGVNGKVLIGKDTRISGYIFESVLEAGLSAAGMNAYLLGPMPTPAIAYLTRTLCAKAGIVISASHNTYHYNGIKIFSANGAKLFDADEIAIESQLEESMHMVAPNMLGKAKRVNDAPARYIEFCKSTLGFHKGLSGLKIVLDCANGATYHVAPAVFRELGTEVIELNVYPDGFNINENCGSTHPQVLAKVVLAEQADLGIAFDGDGDRVIMVDNQGEIVDGDELLFIMAKQHISRKNLLQGGVIGTLMSNLGLEIALRDLGIDFKRTKVGDRYVLEGLQETGWLLGGEPSGHIVNLGITTTGDGIISALQILGAIRDTGKNLHELKKEMNKFPQTLFNVKATNKFNWKNNDKLSKAVRDVEQKLGSMGRVLIRKSGTEPVVRVVVEGENANLVYNTAQQLAKMVELAIVK